MRIPKNTMNVTVFDSEAMKRAFRVKRKSKRALEELASDIAAGKFFIDQFLAGVRREVAFPVLLTLRGKQLEEVKNKCAMVYASMDQLAGIIPEYRPHPDSPIIVENVKVFHEARFIHVNDIKYLVECLRKEITKTEEENQLENV